MLCTFYAFVVICRLLIFSNIKFFKKITIIIIIKKIKKTPSMTTIVRDQWFEFRPGATKIHPDLNCFKRLSADDKSRRPNVGLELDHNRLAL